MSSSPAPDASQPPTTVAASTPSAPPTVPRLSTAPVVVPPMGDTQRKILQRGRLSISHANALTNFDLLLPDLWSHRLVIFLDYDGTLTPIVNDPGRAVLSPEMKATLERLRQRFVTGVISGRSLSKIQQFVNIPELYYAGSHGFDILGPDGTSIRNQVAVSFITHLQQVREAVRLQIADIPGADVEDNIYSVSLHYRNVDPAYHAHIQQIAHAAIDLHPLIKCNEGKMVYEFKPKMDWNKGKALVWLLQALGLDAMDDVFTIYIGDDTTDEDAFAVFDSVSGRKGVGIVVTDYSKTTEATFTLHDTNEVFQFLNRLADLGASVPKEADDIEAPVLPPPPSTSAAPAAAPAPDPAPAPTPASPASPSPTLTTPL